MKNKWTAEFIMSTVRHTSLCGYRPVTLTDEVLCAAGPVLPPAVCPQSRLLWWCCSHQPPLSAVWRLWWDEPKWARSEMTRTRSSLLCGFSFLIGKVGERTNPHFSLGRLHTPLSCCLSSSTCSVCLIKLFGSVNAINISPREDRNPW